MTEHPIEPIPPTDGIPEAVVRRSRRIGLVWVIPLIALAIGAWLAIKAVREAGPTITISFKSAEGLEAGKTKIKYKDVEIGKVEVIRLSPDLSHVTVSAKMVNEIENYLTANTRFWVVRARVASGEVSGLSTLFSGAYIGMDPGQPGSPRENFEGLEKPPVVTLDMPGTLFFLHATRLGSLDVGSPVYYRQIKVGQVVSHAMNADGSALEIQIFVAAPYNQFVQQNTRFWNVSGLDITLDSRGIRINTDSLTSLMLGGVAFETPAGELQTALAEEGRRFFLYGSRDETNEPVYTKKIQFLAYFDETVRGLSKGASVEFRGIKVGEVTDVKLEFSQKQLSFRVPVLMTIEPERFSNLDHSGLPDEAMIAKLIEKGMRAQLRSGLLLTGQLYVNLGMYPDAPSQKLRYADHFPVMPTVPGPTEEITASVANFLNKVEKLPLDKIGSDLQQTIASIRLLAGSKDLPAALQGLRQGLEQLNRFAASLNSQTAPQLGGVLEQARQTLAQTQNTMLTAEQLVGSESAMTHEFNRMVQELSKAGRAVTALADFLERHPEALLYGKGAPKP